MTDHEMLTAQLRRSLQDRAAAVAVTDTPFVAGDAPHHPQLAGPEEAGTHPLWPRLAAAVAVLLVLGGIVLWAHSRPTSSTIEVGPLGPAPARTATTGFVAPTSTPAGRKLWSADVRNADDLAEAARREATGPNPGPGAPLLQPLELFGVDGNTEHAVLLQSSVVSGLLERGPSRPIEVRGRAGAYQAVRDGSGRFHTRITWTEGTTFVADLRGVRIRDAVALLDALHPRSRALLDGFAPPRSGRFRLLGAARRLTSTPIPIRELFLSYSRRPPTMGTGLGRGEPVDVDIVDQAPTSVAGAFLQTWFAGTLQPDGRVVAWWESSRGSALSVVGRDGRSVTVRSFGGPALARADAEALVDSLRPVTEGHLRALASAAADRTVAYVTKLAEAAPLRMAVHVADGTVELRGTARPGHETRDTFYAVCFVGSGVRRSCSAPESGDRGTSGMMTAFSDGDGWLAVRIAPHIWAPERHVVAYEALDRTPDLSHPFGRRIAQQQQLETGGMLIAVARAPRSLAGVWFSLGLSGAGGRVDRPFG